MLKKLVKRIIGWPPSPFWRAVRALAFEVQVIFVTAGSQRAFRKRLSDAPIKLHLGCGDDIRAGWINVDLLPPAALRMSENNHTFVAHDLRRGLPLPDASCEVIYSSHFWEHLEDIDGRRLFQDCYRCLRPGGVFRITLPDFARAFRAYLDHDRGYFNLITPEMAAAPDAMTGADFIQYTVYQHGEHRRFYDPERVIATLRGIGFTHIEEADFDPATDVDTPLRRAYSFTIQARK